MTTERVGVHRYRIGRRQILVAEPGEKAWVGDGPHDERRWLLWFGCGGPTYVLSYARSLEDALEKSAGAIADAGYVGLFVEPEVEDGSTHDCPDAADGYPCTCDLTYTESGYVPSWEWGIAIEDATREQLIAFHRDE